MIEVLLFIGVAFAFVVVICEAKHGETKFLAACGLALTIVLVIATLGARHDRLKEIEPHVDDWSSERSSRP